MRDYHEYKKIDLGGSDIAVITLTGCAPEGEASDYGLKACFLRFVEDGDYSAYVVDADAEIGAHYRMVTSFETWMRTFDDDGHGVEFKADKIVVYRAGEYGCIVQLLNKDRSPENLKYKKDCSWNKNIVTEWDVLSETV